MPGGRVLPGPAPLLPPVEDPPLAPPCPGSLAIGSTFELEAPPHPMTPTKTIADVARTAPPPACTFRRSIASPVPEPPRTACGPCSERHVGGDEYNPLSRRTATGRRRRRAVGRSLRESVAARISRRIGVGAPHTSSRIPASPSQ